MSSSRIVELTEEVSLRGLIHEVNRKTKTFQLSLPNGSVVSVSGLVSDQHIDTVLDGLKLYEQGAKVHIKGLGKFDREGKLQSIASIEHITILDPLDIITRVDELKMLRNGWLDGKGSALPSDGLENSASPYIYPVAEGGVRLEWTIEPQDISLEIDLSRKFGEWHALNLITDDEESRTLNLNDDSDWVWVASRLSEMAGASSRD